MLACYGKRSGHIRCQMPRCKRPDHPIDVVEEGPADLAAYQSVSIAFSGCSRVRLDELVASQGRTIVEEPTSPFRKDYDAHPDDSPLALARRFDLTNWGVLAAFVSQRRVGGALIAYNCPAFDMLENRTDLAVLVDLRVASGERRLGVGKALFQSAKEWSLERGCRWLRVETQDVNVVACRFYRAMGCRLEFVHPNAYPDCPNEAQIVWKLELKPGG